MPHETLKRRDWFKADGFPIAVERREPQTPFGLHSHEFSEIVIITSGQGVHITGDESYPLNAGDVFVIGGSRPHDYHSMDRLCLVNVLFQPDRLDLRHHDLQSLPGYHALFTLEPFWRKRHQFKSRLHLKPHRLGRLMELVEQLDEELRVRPVGFRFLSLALFMQIIGYLSRCYADTGNTDSRSLLRIGKAISHLETHFCDPISVDELAGIAHMSKRSFMRNFQAAMALSPIAYLVQLRINHAAALLRRTNQGVTEIAFASGFNDSNYFARQFRRAFGVSPRQYRRQHSLPH